MLRIHREQLEWFAKKSQVDFVTRMVGYLREEHPRLVEGIPDLGGWLQAAIDRGLGAGIENESEMAQLVLLLLLFGEEPTAHAAWVDPILRDRSLQAVGKVRKLVAEARQRGLQHIDDIDITHTLEDV